MTVDQSPGVPELQQVKRKLTAQLDQVRRQRITDEREAARLSGVRLALAEALRSRDAREHPRM